MDYRILYLNLAALSAIVPICIGLVRFRKIGRADKAVILYLLYSTIKSAILYYTVSGVNTYLSYIFPLVDAIVFIPILYPGRRKHVYSAIVIVTVAVMGEIAGGAGGFSFVSSIVSSLLIVLSALLRMEHIARTSEAEASKAPLFWISAGATAYYAFKFIVDIVRQPVLEAGNQLLAIVFLSQSTVYIVFMVLISIGYSRK